MSATYSTRLINAFALNSEQLKKLCDLLSDRVGNVKLELRCTDEITRSYDQFKKAIEYENPSDKRIDSLRLTARSDDREKSATLEFRATKLWEGISIDLEASEPVVTRLRSELLDIIGGTRTWYSPFSRFEFVSVGLILIGLAWFALVACVAFGLIRTEKKHPDPRADAISQLIVIGVPFLWGFVGIALNRIWKKVFPVGAFLIGQGQQRYEDMEKIRWGVVIAFIISLFTGFIPLAF